MNQIDRDLYLLSKEQRRVTVDAIIGYFHAEREEEIGIVAAESILDFFLEHAGVNIYNNGLEAARTAIDKGFEEANSKIGELMR